MSNRPVRSEAYANPYFDLFDSSLFGRSGLVSSRQERIAELRAAIAAQESMRSTLGDATVELSLKPLRSLLESLLAEESVPSDRESTPRDQALLAELQRYM